MAHRVISARCRIWSLWGHSGHGPTCCWLDPVANDPKQISAGVTPNPFHPARLKRYDPQSSTWATRMRRREFITLLGSAATWPFAARAQQPGATRRVSLLLGLADGPDAKTRVRAFQLGLRDLGWIEGRNVAIDYRYGSSDLGLINQYANEIVGLAPDVIVGNSTPVLAALQQATSSIPIVFAVVNDPVGQGFISSLGRPGSNITGFTFVDFEMIGKWTNLLSDVVPNLHRVVLMFNPDTAPYYDGYLRSFNAMKPPISAEVGAAHVRNFTEIDLTIAKQPMLLLADEVIE